MNLKLQKSYFNKKTLIATVLFLVAYSAFVILVNSVNILSITILIIPFTILFFTVLLHSSNHKNVTLTIFLGLLFLSIIIFLVGIPFVKSSPDTEAFPFYMGIFPLFLLFVCVLPLTLFSHVISKMIIKNKKHITKQFSRPSPPPNSVGSGD
ncbi:MAG: hypothetical protein KAJ14_12220 [Candidatus Omnitrophica bacterium]|nr:hypothetical protein [Candidatus Omnitrophota bacterium]